MRMELSERKDTTRRIAVSIIFLGLTISFSVSASSLHPFRPPGFALSCKNSQGGT